MVGRAKVKKKTCFAHSVPKNSSRRNRDPLRAMAGTMNGGSMYSRLCYYAHALKDALYK